MSRNLLICYDGTWNTPDNNGDIGGNTSTNVRRFYDACAKVSEQGVPQLKWYDRGVGTRWYDRISGGAFGVGLSKNVTQGYGWLVDNFQPGDRVYIIGFSRGAYTARSLVGFIRNCGLVRKTSGNAGEREQLISDGYQLYRARDEGADSPAAKKYRGEYAQEIDIEFLGIWDTVGALGIPISSFDWFNRRYYEFHDTELSSIVRHAYHALATDEHRENYAATLWDPKQKPNQVLEQQWFPGAHANVGGGYKTHALSDVPLEWLMRKAVECGLGLAPRAIPRITRSNYRGKAVDSYDRFLGGLYRVTRDRHFRPIGSTANGGEGIHPSVLARYSADDGYRPKNRVGPHIQGLSDPSLGRIRV